MTPCECANPAICTMDYDKYSPAPEGHWSAPQRMANRVCTKCWAHWFGQVGSVVQYTRTQWNGRMQETSDAQ